MTFGAHSWRGSFGLGDMVPAAIHWQQAFVGLSDSALRQEMDALRKAIAQNRGMRKVAPRVFGLVGESCRRHLGLVPYPAQYRAAVSLARGEIAQMNTGEGKTLTALLPAALKGLAGRGVHLITVNEYLARRDFEANQPVLNALGLSVGLSLSGMTVSEKQAAYASDITYTTATEAGFDHLRDEVAAKPEHRVQRGLAYALLDEADSILLDEAVTPMILSGGGNDDIRPYQIADTFARYLKPLRCAALDEAFDTDECAADYVVDERRKTAVLTNAGVEKAERYYRVQNLFDRSNIEIYHRILQALSAYGTLRRDVDYILRADTVQILDHHTGRVMAGRRFAAGLHQAVEAKEGVPIHPESRVIASVTYQKYFLLYAELAGMTGTAWPARRELSETYGRRVRRIPPNRPSIRRDCPDAVYPDTQTKLNALADAAQAAYRAARPVLVGTPNDAVSEAVSALFCSRGIAHLVLNAKQDANEAALVAKAGMPGAVTVATNMAGRGTDIRLGDGDPETAARVCALGGLLVLGAERQFARRVDDQLIGRAGRQGDPGESQFFLCPDDELIRLFGAPDRRLTPKAVRRAQVQAERADAGMRIAALEADDILQTFRREFLGDRDRLLESTDPAHLLHTLIRAAVRHLQSAYPSPENRYADFRVRFSRVFGAQALPPPAAVPYAADYAACACRVFDQKVDEAPGVFVELCRAVLLQCMDEAWSYYLDEFEDLKTGYRLMAFGKPDPKRVLIEYGAKLLVSANEFVLLEGLRRVFCCRLTRQTGDS